MLVELWVRKREMGEEDKNDMEDKSVYENSGVGLAWLGLKDGVSVMLCFQIGTRISRIVDD